MTGEIRSTIFRLMAPRSGSMAASEHSATPGKRIRLKDGRYLGYEGYGDPRGKLTGVGIHN